DPETVSILPDGQGTGDIQLQVSGAGGTIRDIPISAGNNDTLAALAGYINSQNTQNNWGVTATVVQDSGGYHLVITSQAKGPAGALAFNANNTNLTATNNPAMNLKFEVPVGGTNANLTVDEIPFSSTTNTVNGAIPGVTLNLVSAEPDVPLQLAVSPDTTQATNAVNTFITAYNALITAINQQFTVNTTTNTEGPLGSDSSLRQLQSSLLNDISFSPPGSNNLVNLVSLGITTNDDGTLTLGTAPDGRTLNDLLSSDPGAVQAFFQNTANTGFANNFHKDLTSLTDPSQGILNLDLAQNNTEQTNLGDDISNLQGRLATQKQQLINEFSQVNATLEEYPYLLAEITAQLGNILPTSSNTSPSQGSITSSSSSSSSSTS
ncbi:MAG: flagellar filament capping protein FliD, partial [Acidobacteriaceae bacterium]|nr:flagellar filament capping protein FliD [Acidobacteriaceae bacterium]